MEEASTPTTSGPRAAGSVGGVEVEDLRQCLTFDLRSGIGPPGGRLFRSRSLPAARIR
jgi:hypothetical protein